LPERFNLQMDTDALFKGLVTEFFNRINENTLRNSGNW
jgi:hypothetical protein